VIETPIGTPPDKLPAFAGLKLIHPEVCDHAIPESSPVTGSIFTPEDEGAKLTHPISFPHPAYYQLYYTPIYLPASGGLQPAVLYKESTIENIKISGK
jgi:hypothetical protein